MKASISILGICVLRDIFGLHKNNGDYQIDRFIQSVNPISSVSKSMLQKNIGHEDEEIQDIFRGEFNFYKRNLLFDLNKTIFPYLSEVKSEYLMIDAGTCRFDLLRYSDKGGDDYLTVALEDKIKKLMEKGYLPRTAKIIQLSEMSNEIFSAYMDLFVEQILEMYRREQIILVDCQAVPYSITKMRDKINFFDSKIIEKWYININRGYRYLRKNLVGCHVIEFPTGMVADEGHKWGRASLHYVPEYYDYALEAVNVITQENLSYENEQEKLRNLKEQCEDLVKLKYETLMFKNFRYLKERDNICTRMIAYEKFMQDLLLHDGKILWIYNFMKENQFDHCAFYGLSELAKFFIKMFRRWVIQIDYVVEDIQTDTYEDILCIRKKEQSYPETQVMIIMDVVLKDKIKDKLTKMNLSYPVYDIYEIFQK